MIICYHKIFPVAKTHWWLTVDSFHRQMTGLRAYDVVTLDDYDPTNTEQVVVTFDGVYDNVLKHALPVLSKFGYPFELFVIGDWIGRENTFDQAVEPPCRFASLDELDALVAGGGRVQWHTNSHPRLAGLPAMEVERELTVPEALARRYGPGHLEWFAYPHGDTREEDRALVRLRFKGALACDDGDASDRHMLPRTLVFERHDFFRSKVTVRVSLGNHPWLVGESLDSLERQSVRPDAIQVSADSTQPAAVEPIIDALKSAGMDVTKGGMEDGQADGFIVRMTAGDRLRGDYIAECRIALDQTPNASSVTTDLLAFGPGIEGSRSPADERVGRSRRDGWEVYRRGGDPYPLGRGGMYRRSSEGAAALHLDQPLYELYDYDASEHILEGTYRELCRREAMTIHHRTLAQRRSKEVERLNAAYGEVVAELERFQEAHRENQAEIVRVNLAYGALHAEFQRVSKAYGLLSAELVRVNEAFGEQRALAEGLRAQAGSDGRPGARAPSRPASDRAD